jgi:hypothetical protein
LSVEMYLLFLFNILHESTFPTILSLIALIKQDITG